MPFRFSEATDKVVLFFTESRVMDETDIHRLGEELSAAFDRAAELGKNMVVDCRDLQYMSSAMLGKLVGVSSRCKKRDIQFSIANLSPDILEMFNVMKLQNVIKIDDNYDDPETKGSPVPLPGNPSADAEQANPPAE